MSAVDRNELLVRHLSAFLRQRAGDTDPVFDQTVERLIRQTIDGHVAIDLAGEHQEGHAGRPVRELRNSLLASKIVGKPGQYRPIILDDENRLYLHRYWDYEQKVADLLGERAARQAPGYDASVMAQKLAGLFTGLHDSRQKMAAAISALQRVTVISGGPGTGKTTAVVRILALLLEMDPGLQIALAAPTGKAAARASDAVRRAETSLSLSDLVRERVPREASTIHRLLGLRPGYSRYNADNRLPYDVVVVDEASMIGVSLMARLLAALHPDCRLILLGDKDQLSSVEPGSVLGDICSFETGYTRKFADELERLGVEHSAAVPDMHRLQDCVVRLTHSFRFDADSGIGRLANAIRRGEADTALALLKDPCVPEVQLHETDSIPAMRDRLAAQLLGNLRRYMKSVSDHADPGTVLATYDSFRLLCALRQGPVGVGGLNAFVEQVLADDGLIDLNETWYAGRPVMVNSNDYMLQLFNGDIGITLRDAGDNDPHVVFESQDGIRSLHTPRLPEHSTVFAMTVHKAQGSEFDDVAFVLPDEANEFLGRELIYTAVTRARRSVEIYGQADVLHAAIGRVQQRASGLADKLRFEPAEVLSQGPGQGPGQGQLF